MTDHGYVMLRVGKDHPLADRNGWAYEHHLAMGRKPKRGHLFHHVNDVKTDNRPDNLEERSRGWHNRHHNKQKGRDGATGQFRKAG